MRILFSTILLVFGILSVDAQHIKPRQNYYGILTDCSIVVKDSVTQRGLEYAHVKIKMGKDSINLVTNLYGTARFPLPLTDSIRITVSYMGYATISESVLSKTRDFEVFLPTKVESLNEVIIRGGMLAIVNKGDTITYNASAFKVLSGDPLSKLFEKIPGAEIRDGQLFYMGELVDQIRFDNETLFGNNARLALETVQASDVVKIDFFKEDSDFNKANKITNEKKRTIANVTTVSKPKMIRNSTLAALGGKGLEEDLPAKYADHYLGEGHFVYTRVGETVEISAFANKNTRVSFENMVSMGKLGSGIGNSEGGKFNYNRYEHGKYNFSTDNSLLNDRDYMDDESQREYHILDGAYASRSFNSANSTENRIRGGKSDNSFQITLKDKSSIRSALSASYVKNSDYANRRYGSLLDGKLLSSADIHRRESVGSFKLNGSASWSKVFKTSKVRLNIRGAAILDKNDLNGWQLDTAATSTLRTHLVSTGSGHDNSYSGTIGVGIPLGSKLWTFSLNQSIKYDDTKARRLSDDLMNGLVDTVNSYDYTVDMLTWASSIDLQYNNYARKDGGISSVMMNMNWEHSSQQRKEFMPENYHISRTFRVPFMSVAIRYKMTDFKNMTFSLVAQPERLSIEQLREELDNRNPLQLRAGNPMLKIPVKVGMQWSSTLISKSGNNMNIALEVYKTENAITSRTRFFDADTKLPDYNDYVALAGSSLTTPENSSKSWLATARMRYSLRLKPLRSTMNLDLAQTYQNLPIYVHSMPASRKSHRSNVGVSISTSFSTKFETTVSYRPILSFEDNSMEKNKTFSQGLDVDLRFVSSKGYTATFNARWYDYYTKIGEGFNNLILNPSVGKRFGKKQNFSVKVEGHDLLNQTKIFSVGMEDDYVVTTRRYALGRYVTCRLEYKF